MLTAQEVYDTVRQHMLTQGRKAQSYPGGVCKYRAVCEDQVLKCAAGALIADEYYNGRMEGQLVRNSSQVRCALQLSGVAIDDPYISALVCSLQHVHDRVEPDRWNHELWQVAVNFGLNGGLY